MILQLTELSEEPLYKQLTNQLADRISKGELVNGTELPPAGRMARAHRVNMNTVKRAYNELEKDGFIQCKGENGAIVISPPSQRGRISERQILSTLHSLPDMTASHFSEPIQQSELNNQLAKVHQIQTNLLPKTLPENESISVAAHCHPTHIVGGDFYDCIRIDEHRFGFVIADACGNGLPAAMLISQTQAILKSELNNGNGIKRILENMNRQIFQNSPKDTFVTFFFGMLDTTTGEFQYVNAGHNYPIRIRRNGNPERLNVGGLALGMFPDATYDTGRVALEKGDTLFLFTDGLTEAMNSTFNEYGEQRLLDVLHRYQYHTPQKILENVLNDVGKFCGTKMRQDDCTILIVKIGESQKTELRHACSYI